MRQLHGRAAPWPAAALHGPVGSRHEALPEDRAEVMVLERAGLEEQQVLRDPGADLVKRQTPKRSQVDAPAVRALGGVGAVLVELPGVGAGLPESVGVDAGLLERLGVEAGARAQVEAVLLEVEAGVPELLAGARNEVKW